MGQGLDRTLLGEEIGRLGFDVWGVAPVAVELRREYFLRWLEEGQHGGMGWLAKEPERRLDPAKVLPEACSIIVVGLNYYQPETADRGRIAKYALGGDYHRLMTKRLKSLCTWLRGHGGINRPYVDTGPVLEKPVAEAAGLGWQGKSTILLHRKFGTWLFIGEVLTSLKIEPDPPGRDHCGTCTLCIGACPTQAITGPYQLDARRCIAYLTIEHHGAIPLEWRRPIGDHLFGCDDCLDVCPWNRWAQTTREARFAARPRTDLAVMLGWGEADFAATYQGTPIFRLRLPRWKRNIAVVLGNVGTAADLPALDRAAVDPDPLVAEHAAWAAAEIRGRLG